MGVLRVDPTGADAYLLKTLTFPSEFWVTFRLAFPPVSLAAWTVPNEVGYSGGFLGIGSGGADVFIDVDSYFPGPQWFAGGDFSDGSDTPAPVADTYQLVEFHFESGVEWALYIDGTLVNPGNIAGVAYGSHDLTLGQLFGTDFPGICWFDDLTVGTTRGGTEIFADDFEGDLSAWDSTTGDVSIISDPLSVPAPIGVCIAFDDSTLEPDPTWTRIDDPDGYRLVSDWSIRRGRSSELDKTGTGTATIHAIDRSGDLDPTNSGSPFLGKLDPMKQAAIALFNPVAETWHTIYRGFVGEWFYELDQSAKFLTATLELTDAFDLLAALELTPGHHGDTAPDASLGDIYFNETSGPTPGPFTRINQALDDAGWPADLRMTLTGNVQLQASIYARRDQLLAVLFDTADAEFPGVANLYVDKTGRVTFHGRYARFEPEDPDYQIEFWNVGTAEQAEADPTIVPLSGLGFRRSKNDLINAALNLPQIPGGGEFTSAEMAAALVKDDTSIATYGWRSISNTDLLTLSGRAFVGEPFTINALDETHLFSEFFVANYKDPHTRVTTMTFRPLAKEHPNAAALWELMCRIEIGDVVTLQTSHPGGGGFDEDFFVEGISYDAAPMRENIHDVTLTLDVSPRAFYGDNPFGPSDGG